jgi:hypothetical protein
LQSGSGNSGGPVLNPGGPPWRGGTIGCPPTAAPLSATTTKSTKAFKFSAIYCARRPARPPSASSAPIGAGVAVRRILAS